MAYSLDTFGPEFTFSAFLKCTVGIILFVPVVLFSSFFIHWCIIIVCTSTHPSIYPSIHPLTHSFTHPSIHLSSVHTYIHPYIHQPISSIHPACFEYCFCVRHCLKIRSYTVWFSLALSPTTISFTLLGMTAAFLFLFLSEYSSTRFLQYLFLYFSQAFVQMSPGVPHPPHCSYPIFLLCFSLGH